jgi:hypothetical protein
VTGGDFTAGEMVHLISKVTYNDAPVQNKLVAFEVLNPSDEVVLIRTAITDGEGIAMTSFRTPLILISNGTWTAISTVSLADKVEWDITTFQVYLVIPVGGHSVSINVKSEKEPTAQYIIAIAILTAFTTIKRKTTRKQVKAVRRPYLSRT